MRGCSTMLAAHRLFGATRIPGTVLPAAIALLVLVLVVAMMMVVVPSATVACCR